MLGEITDKHEFVFGDEVVTLEEAIDTWKKPLEKVFPTRSEGDQSIVATTRHYTKGNIYVCKNKVAKPNVFIPVFQEQTVNMIQRKHLNVQERT